MECFIGRDTREEHVVAMIDKLEHWYVVNMRDSMTDIILCFFRCVNCASVVSLLETQVMRANDLKREKLRLKDMTENEVY